MVLISRGIAYTPSGIVKKKGLTITIQFDDGKEKSLPYRVVRRYVPPPPQAAVKQAGDEEGMLWIHSVPAYLDRASLPVTSQSVQRGPLSNDVYCMQSTCQLRVSTRSSWSSGSCKPRCASTVRHQRSNMNNGIVMYETFCLFLQTSASVSL